MNRIKIVIPAAAVVAMGFALKTLVDDLSPSSAVLVKRGGFSDGIGETGRWRNAARALPTPSPIRNQKGLAGVADGNSIASLMGWTAFMTGGARVEVVSDPLRKYPLVRREHLSIRADDGGAPRTVILETVADHVILKVDLPIADPDQLAAELPPGYTLRKVMRMEGRFLIGFDGSAPSSLPGALADLAAFGETEPDGYVTASAVPDDPRFSEQWGLGDGPGGMRAAAAWDRTTGATGVTVAVIDTGVDYTHPDLADNIWINPGESGDGKETNGIDDDGNGLIDDWRGWDFAAAGVGDNDPIDDREIDGQLVGHGTHVAGIIGAQGNDGTGVAGVAWEVDIMALKALDSAGRGTWSDIADALAYAAEMGAPICNNAYGSWVAPSSTISGAVEMTRDAGMLFVASAGNGDYPGNGATTGDDLDLYPYFPASFAIDNVVCVAAHGIGGELAPFSNYGLAGADLSAPGVDILSTLAGGGHGNLSGTSMSSGFVSGAAAIALASDSDLDRIGLQRAILAGSSRTPGYRGLLRWAAKVDLDGTAALGARMPADLRIAAANSHILQVRPDGTVAGWGKAGFVGLGESAGDAEVVATPRTLPPFDDTLGVAAVGFSSYILNRSGEVWVAGQVRWTPSAPVVAHDDFTLVATIPGALGIFGHGSVAGDWNENVAVIDADGGLWISGSNAHRQLGSSVAAATPFSDQFHQVPGLPPVVSADVHGGTVFAVDEDGLLWNWGELPFSAVPSPVPGALPPLRSVVSDYPDNDRIAAITGSGDALLIDPIFGSPETVALPGAASRAFAAGSGAGESDSGYGFVLADGSVRVGVEVEVDDVAAAVSNGATGVALLGAGTSFSWGSKLDGLRGIGIYEFRAGASPFHRLPSSAQAFSSGQGLAVVGDDGFLRGIRYEDSFTRPDSIPRFPVFLGGLTPDGVVLTDLADGFSASILVFSDGSVFGAGENFAGQLGDLPASTAGFERITFPGGAVAVAAGYSHTLLLDASGQVWAAGDNSAGQFGIGAVPGGGVFRLNPSLSGVTKIASDGFTASYALDDQGRLWRWGDFTFSNPVVLPIAEGVNAAIGKPVSASGETFGPAYPPGAITDGRLDTFSLPPVDATLGFYFQIDLLGSVDLERIVVHNRQDGGGAPERLSNYRVSILADNGTGAPGAVVWSADVRTDGSNSGAGGSDELLADADPGGSFAGRFVRIENLSGDPYNPQIAEVDVFPMEPAVAGSRVVDFALADFGSGATDSLVVATADGRILVYRDPFASADPAPSSTFHLPGVRSVALGSGHGLASNAAGEVYAWGDNSAGQLGLGNFDPAPSGRLVRVADAGRAVAVLAHGRASFALGESGRLWRWGEDIDLTNLLAQDRATQTLAVGLSDEVFDSGNSGDDWWRRNFTTEQLSDDEVSGTESNPDSDELSNLFEYALDSKPFQWESLAAFFGITIERIPEGGTGSHGGPSANDLIGGQRHAVLRLHRGAKRGDLDYRFEVSDDLVNWRSGQEEFFVAVDNEVLLLAYDLQPVEGARQRHYRLAVSFQNANNEGAE